MVNTISYEALLVYIWKVKNTGIYIQGTLLQYDHAHINVYLSGGISLGFCNSQVFLAKLPLWG
jgi:hypothetical protein